MNALAVSLLLIALSLPLIAQDYHTYRRAGPINSINSQGVFVGKFGPSGHALVQQVAGVFLDIGTLGGPSASALGINDASVVVGESDTTGPFRHAFIWTQESGMQDLGSLLGGNSSAFLINNAGEVAGWSNSADGSVTHAFYWSSDLGSIDLGTLRGSLSTPAAINNSGVIVGQSSIGNTTHAFSWTVSEGMKDLGSLAGSSGFSQAIGINNSGLIIGSSAVSGSSRHAVLWSSGTLQDIGTLGGNQSWASFINDAGNIVGSSVVPSSGKKPLLHTFFWTTASGMTDIGTLPEKLNAQSIPQALSNRDEIIGFNGGTFFWTPSAGIHQVQAISVKTYMSAIGKRLNDDGEFIGGLGNGGGAAARPIEHISITSSLNPALVGENVSFIATIGSVVGPPPDGDAFVFIDGKAGIGEAFLTNGTATITTSFSHARVHRIRGYYPEDTTRFGQVSEILDEVVNTQ